MMASVRTAASLLLPPVSVLLVAAGWCLCRVAARKLSALLARAHQFPSSGGGHAALRELLPVALYHRRTSCGGGEEQDEQCALCLSVIEDGSEVRELKCRHLFHRGCLDRWLAARPLATCPLCRCRLLQAPCEEEVSDSDSEDSDMMLFMACVHSRSSWLWPS